MRPPDPNPPRGSSARRAEASKKANENVEKAEQERQQASRDAANNPNDASKQAKDLEAQQKLDEAVTNRAKLDDEVREANDAYQNAYKEAETAANNMAADTPDKTLKLRDAKRRYDAALEAAKAKSARVLAPGWNRQRFAELMGAPAPGHAAGRTGHASDTAGRRNAGDRHRHIGQTQTPPTAAQVPKINVITDIAGGGEEYNTSGYHIRMVRHIHKGRLEHTRRISVYRFPAVFAAAPQTPVQPATGSARRSRRRRATWRTESRSGRIRQSLHLYGAGFFYIPGTDTCMKLGGYVRADLGNGISFEFQADNPISTSACGHANLIRLPLIGMEKNTESGFPYGTLRCFPPSTGVAPFQSPPQQGTAYGLPDLVGNLSSGSAWGPSPVRSRKGRFRSDPRTISTEAALRTSPDSRRFRPSRCRKAFRQPLTISPSAIKRFGNSAIALIGNWASA